MRNVDALAQYMPTEAPVYRITDIDFERWAAEGVNTLVVDVEATLGESGSPELIPEFVGALVEARAAGIQNIALHTNKRIKTQADRLLLRSWENQIAEAMALVSGDDEPAPRPLVLTPLADNERKPSPRMIYKVMEHFGVTADQVGAIGDKATADMQAAYLAGVGHRAWTRAFGDNRHVGDRIARDPFEAALRVYAHLLLTPEVEDQALGPDIGEPSGVVRPDKLSRPDSPDGLDNIVGFGVDDIELSSELLDALRQPAYVKAVEQLKSFYDEHGRLSHDKLKAFLNEHGRQTANALTWGRLAIAGGIIMVNRSNLKPRDKHLAITGLVALGYLTDLLDGTAARADKRGASERGGALDPLIDKILSAATDIFAVLPRGAISELDILVTMARDTGMTALRRPFNQRGISTKAIKSGKLSTNGKAFAQVFGLLFGNRYPGRNKSLQRAAVVGKLASALYAPIVWVEKHEQKLHEHKNWQRLGQLALETATE